MKKRLKQPSYKGTQLLRIAPVCNGKIYTVPHQAFPEGECLFDIPIQEEAATTPSPTGKSIQKLKKRYQLHIKTSERPRFCAKYQLKTQRALTVYLYILPLQKEDDIQFKQGQFITKEEILGNSHSFSPYLIEESELLDIAAELWHDFYTHTIKS